MIHLKRACVALILLACCFSFYGCPVLVVGGAAVAGGTGTYYYVEGEMRTDYYFSVDGVWSGVEKTIADMKGRDDWWTNGSDDSPWYENHFITRTAEM